MSDPFRSSLEALNTAHAYTEALELDRQSGSQFYVANEARWLIAHRALISGSRPLRDPDYGPTDRDITDLGDLLTFIASEIESGGEDTRWYQ